MKMVRRFALIVVLVIAALGIVFVGLDVFDIEEDFGIYLSTAIIDTILIAVVALPVAYFAARNFLVTGSWQMLCLGCGVLAFGMASLLREWLRGSGLYEPVTVYHSLALIASVIHLIGAGLSVAGLLQLKAKVRQKTKAIVLCYLSILLTVSLITVLTFRGFIPPFLVPEESSIQLKDIIRGITTALFLASSLIYLRVYFKLRTDFLYWYSLGLMLFAFGSISVFLGENYSRIVWWGRASQYIGSIYFLIAVLGAHRKASVRRGSEPKR